MKLNLVWIAVLALGCGKKKDEPPPAPFTGALTVERVMAAKDAVKLLEPWDKAYPKLLAKLGTPQKIEGGKHKWAAVEGDVCAYVEISSGDGKPFGKQGIVVDATQEPMTVDKSGPLFNRADCMEIAGKAGVPEDPNAPAPAADGVVTPADFQRYAVVGRSKWVGKQVTITGEVVSTGGVLVTIDKDARVDCVMKSDASSDLVGTQVTAAGTVKLSTSVTGAGDVSQSAQLADCTITPAAGVGDAAGSAGSADDAVK